RPPQIGPTSMHDVVQIRSNVLHPAAAAPWQDTKLHVLHRDYETRSHSILKTVGTYKYATDPSTEVLCCAYAVDDEGAAVDARQSGAGGVHRGGDQSELDCLCPWRAL